MRKDLFYLCQQQKLLILLLIHQNLFIIKKPLMNRLSLRAKQNPPFTASQPRQSLKKNMTSRKKPQKNQARMSMLPLKSQRLSVTIESQLTQQRPSISALSQNNNILNTLNNTINHAFYNSAKKSISKQVIISNLVNKLDEKEQIRSIIETKLKSIFFHEIKGGNCYENNKEVVYTSDFQPFASLVSLQKAGRNPNVTQSSKKSSLLHSYGDEVGQNQHQNEAEVHFKLRKCQQELAYFKSIVGNLEKKVKNLQGDYERKISMKKNKSKVKQQLSDCDECIKCSKSNLQKKNFRRVLNAQTQTDQNEQYPCQKQQKNLQESDFFDNLQKTLRVLDRTKMF